MIFTLFLLFHSYFQVNIFKLRTIDKPSNSVDQSSAYLQSTAYIKYGQNDLQQVLRAISQRTIEYELNLYEECIPLKAKLIKSKTDARSTVDNARVNLQSTLEEITMLTEYSTYYSKMDRQLQSSIQALSDNKKIDSSKHRLVHQFQVFYEIYNTTIKQCSSLSSRANLIQHVKKGEDVLISNFLKKWKSLGFPLEHANPKLLSIFKSRSHLSKKLHTSQLSSKHCDSIIDNGFSHLSEKFEKLIQVFNIDDTSISEMNNIHRLLNSERFKNSKISVKIEKLKSQYSQFLSEANLALKIQGNEEEKYANFLKKCDSLTEDYHSDISELTSVRNSAVIRLGKQIATDVIDCEVSHFIKNGKCLKNKQVYTRQILVKNNAYGIPCPKLSIDSPCEEIIIPQNLGIIDCGISEWSEWGECDDPCGHSGGGYQRRWRSRSATTINDIPISLNVGIACGDLFKLSEDRPCDEISMEREKGFCLSDLNKLSPDELHDKYALNYGEEFPPLSNYRECSIDRSNHPSNSLVPGPWSKCSRLFSRGSRMREILYTSRGQSPCIWSRQFEICKNEENFSKKLIKCHGGSRIDLHNKTQNTSPLHLQILLDYSGSAIYRNLPLLYTRVVSELLPILNGHYLTIIGFNSISKMLLTGKFIQSGKIPNFDPKSLNIVNLENFKPNSILTETSPITVEKERRPISQSFPFSGKSTEIKIDIPKEITSDLTRAFSLSIKGGLVSPLDNMIPERKIFLILSDGDPMSFPYNSIEFAKKIKSESYLNEVYYLPIGKINVHNKHFAKEITSSPKYDYFINIENEDNVMIIPDGLHNVVASVNHTALATVITDRICRK